MPKLKDTLLNFSDNEFAFFYTYRRHSFLNESKDKIEDNKKQRSLTIDKIKHLVETKPEIQEGNCPRCNSSKFQEEIENEINVRSGIQFDVITNRCIVCDYNPEIGKSLNWKMKLKKEQVPE